MKQIEIKQKNANYLKQGDSDFLINKDPNLEGIIELVVLEHTPQEYQDGYLPLCACKMRWFESEREQENGISDWCIKNRLTVKLTKSEISVYEIGVLVGSQVQKNHELLQSQPKDITLNKWFKFWSELDVFLKNNYKKDNKPFYWYDVEIIKED